MNDQPIKNILTLPIDVELLVPHRRPVCMIDRLVEYRDESGVVEALLRSGNILVGEDGVLDRTAYMELIAQAYAAFKGYRDLLHEKPVKKGFLVVVKHMECMGEALLGDLLRINVTTTSEVGDFAIAEGIITLNDKVIASGSLTLWIP
jgi:predicted hotdog family 3-hydroxylacyl-ACP dehydratase